MTKEKTSEDEDIGKIYELGKRDDIFKRLIANFKRIKVGKVSVIKHHQ